MEPTCGRCTWVYFILRNRPLVLLKVRLRFLAFAVIRSDPEAPSSEHRHAVIHVFRVYRGCAVEGVGGEGAAPIDKEIMGIARAACGGAGGVWKEFPVFGCGSYEQYVFVDPVPRRWMLMWILRQD